MRTPPAYRGHYQTIPDLCANVKPISRPDYRVTIQTGKKNAIVVLDTYQNNDNVEIVGWRQVDEDGLEKMKKQARREDGQFLILSPINGLAADLSALQTGLSSTCKDTEKLKMQVLLRKSRTGNSC